MKNKTILLFFILLIGSLVSCNLNDYSRQLGVVNTKEKYAFQVEKNDYKLMVDLKEVATDFIFDIRYATKNNFTGEKIYPSNDAFLRKYIAEDLKKANDSLMKLGYQLKILDAYRPYSATIKFYEIYPDGDFVANPMVGSRHNRGTTVDVTLVDRKTGKDLEMPTKFDVFTKEAHPNFDDLPPHIIENKMLLINVMKHFKFDVHPNEWWHYDHARWQRYPMMDLTFKQIKDVAESYKEEEYDLSL